MPAEAVARFEAPAGWRAIDLLSDVHLSEDHPRTFEAWRGALLDTDADAVFLLGDVFEVWIGDDARSGAFEQRCIDVLRQASRQRHLAFMPGNRDFLVGRDFLADARVQALADPTRLDAFGQRVLLTHGDALCLDDVEYQRLRTLLRNPAWQQQVLARPMAERAALAQGLRRASDAKREEAAPAGTAGFDTALWADVDGPEAVRWLEDADAAVMVHGHTHRPGRHALPGQRERWVLSDWEFDAAPPRADVLRLTADGLSRRAVTGPW